MAKYVHLHFCLGGHWNPNVFGWLLGDNMVPHAGCPWAVGSELLPHPRPQLRDPASASAVTACDGSGQLGLHRPGPWRPLSPRHHSNTPSVVCKLSRWGSQGTWPHAWRRAQISVFLERVYTHEASLTGPGCPVHQSPQNVCVSRTPVQGRTFVTYPHAQSPHAEQRNCAEERNGEEGDACVYVRI